MKDWSTHKVVCNKQQTSAKSTLHNDSMEESTNDSSAPSCCGEQDRVTAQTSDRHSSRAQPDARDIWNSCSFDSRTHRQCLNTKEIVTPAEVCDNASSAKNCGHSECLHTTHGSNTSHAVNCKKTETSFNLPEVNPDQPSVCIRVKANKEKHTITLQSDWTAATMMKVVSHNVRIPLDRLKLICKGKQVTVDTIAGVATNKAVFQAIGDQAEDEDGLEASEIELIMRQTAASRNEAVRSLRKTQDVIDAIFDITNK